MALSAKWHSANWDVEKSSDWHSTKWHSANWDVEKSSDWHSAKWHSANWQVPVNTPTLFRNSFERSRGVGTPTMYAAKGVYSIQTKGDRIPETCGV